MDIKNIHYLFALEEYGNVSAASSKLYISQPTLSQFLKKYEEYLGYTIFIRTKEGLKLTQEGRVFLDTARQIIKLEQDMQARLADTSDKMTGEITFALSAQRGLSVLPLVLPKFTRQYPNITVNIMEGHTKSLEYQLQKGDISLAFLVPPLNNPALPCEVFMKEEMFLAVPKSISMDLEVHQSPGRIPWVDLTKSMEQYLFILADTSYRTRDFTNEVFQRYDFVPQKTMTFRNINLLAKLASSGMGITILPETFIEPEYALDYYSIGEKGCFRSLALGYPPYGYRSAAVQKFADMLIEELRQRQEIFRAAHGDIHADVHMENQV